MSKTHLVLVMLLSCVAFSALAADEARNFKKVRGDCELAHMWKDPQGPRAFNE